MTNMKTSEQVEQELEVIKLIEESEKLPKPVFKKEEMDTYLLKKITGFLK